MTLRCDVDGNPEPEISWTYEDSRRVLSTGGLYKFLMNPEMAGKYTCTARVPGFTEVSADAHVFLKGDSPFPIVHYHAIVRDMRKLKIPDFFLQVLQLSEVNGYSTDKLRKLCGSSAKLLLFLVLRKSRGLTLAMKSIQVSF